jgi:uncharacterized integral membrane protein (TIGR00697 family)
METSANNIIKNSKYFLYIGIAFVAVLMISNTVAVKIVHIGPLVFSGAIFLFPISYIFGDILTEVYGYKASRKIILSGFAALVFMSFYYWLIQMLPSAGFWSNQEAYAAILGFVPRIVFASIVGYFVGEFTNSYVLSKMKILSNGKHLWKRTIGSTVVGEGVDSIIFGLIAFAGTIPLANLGVLILSGYLFKVVYEIIITPVTYIVVNKLKKVEGVDVYDLGIDYNPFSK